MSKPRQIELLSPAKDVEIAKSAITHGADAVYIGPEGFGARSAAANNTDDIRRLCEFAHPYRARVYATVNTLVYDKELIHVERMIHRLYRAGVDALIVQDMGILRLDLPPIALHASTQCDTRTPEKALFLQEAGFSQIVLARELTLAQIHDICKVVKVPVETFVHGALCVSYSGRCHASQAVCGRSANRGRCAQLCRLPYTLREANGHILAKNKYLLSLKDFNASSLVGNMLEAGISSFKIEGRLKDEAYVKNVTAYYRRLLDAEISNHPDLYARASVGESAFKFEPDPQKSFNRGFTHYFLEERRPHNIASLNTPKSLGEPITDPAQLHAGDGVSYFDAKGEYTGVRVNKMTNGHPVFARPVKLNKWVQLYRTTNFEYDTLMVRKDTASRKIKIDCALYENCVRVCDERGCEVTLPVPSHGDDAHKPMEPRRFFEKLGDTIYELRAFDNHLLPSSFIPASVLTDLRRRLLTALDSVARATFTRPLREKENINYLYPASELTFADNVANEKAVEFYRSHGVNKIEPAMETIGDFRDVAGGVVLMTTRHCILRELGMCKRESKQPLKEPLILTNPGGAAFNLTFDCKACEMHVCKP
ncbi:MAG: U32 family peptidase [Muribaculaceae bacterium]|nr:U32 family peptidase [Muribaculaceae bacterium]